MKYKSQNNKIDFYVYGGWLLKEIKKINHSMDYKTCFDSKQRYIKSWAANTVSSYTK